MRVFVTGATGYIGTAICAAVKKQGHDVIGLARTQEAANTLLSAGVHPVLGSLAEHRVLREMTHDADAVIHTAFMRGAEGVSLEKAALDTMLDAVTSNHEAFIYTSGSWVYGNTGPTPLDESAPLDPIELVAWRPEHERLVLNSHHHKLRTVVIRPGLVYGEAGGIPGMMLASAQMNTLFIVGDGENHWSTVRVDALAALYAAALERAPARAIYNGVNGDPVKYGEVARAVSRAAGGDGQLESVPLERARGLMGPFADAFALDQKLLAARAQTELGWDPDRPTILDELAGTTIV
jgi:nucleoside-diphosphate-sugar epimerase